MLGRGAARTLELVATHSARIPRGRHLETLSKILITKPYKIGGHFQTDGHTHSVHSLVNMSAVHGTYSML